MGKHKGTVTLLQHFSYKLYDKQSNPIQMADNRFRSTQISLEGGADTYHSAAQSAGSHGFGGGFFGGGLAPLEGPLGLPLGRKGGVLDDDHRHCKAVKSSCEVCPTHDSITEVSDSALK